MIERYSSGGPYEDRIGYSRAVRAGSWVVTAGCTDIRDLQLRPVGDAYAQAMIAFQVGIDALAEAGCPRESIVQSRMYVRDPADAPQVGRAHHQLLGSVRPAATLLVVAGFLDPRILVEVELAGWWAA